MFYITMFVDDDGEEMDKRICRVRVPILGIEAREATSGEVWCKRVSTIDQTVKKRVELRNRATKTMNEDQQRDGSWV